MKLKFFFVVTILGFITVTEGRFPKFDIEASAKIYDPEVTKDLDSKLEDEINEKWRQHTLQEDADDTVFDAYILNSKIRGKKMITLFENRTIYAYQGFRFGKAERFLPPEDLDNYWGGEEIFNATHIGLKCPQGGSGPLQPGGDEDCLFLNVYTPYKPGSVEARNLTVMFYIHGGGFLMGNAALYLPTRLLNHDVILVTIHYRLAAFGFYTRDSPNAPGNMAFYDMISALRWVQRNIEDFGGNPELVTIFGESAGSIAVNFMMLLTGQENLFRGVIAESGSALDHWAFDEDPSHATAYYEQYVGCNSSLPEGEVLECMRKVPFQDLVEAENALNTQDRKNGFLGQRGCTPTLQTFDDTGLNFKKILYQHPRDYLIKREFKDVPFLTGANREEGSLFFGAWYFRYLVPNNLAHNATYWREENLRDMLLSIGVKDETMALAKTLQKRHCPGVDLGDFINAQYCLIDIVGVLIIKAGGWQMCNYHSYYSENKDNTFYYSFEFDSDDSTGAWINPNSSYIYTGISHADDLLYLFAMPVLMDDFPGQKNVYERFTLLWTNFARYLNPTPDEDTKWQDLGVPKWTPYNFEDPHFMVMDTEFTVLQDYSDRWTITNDQHVSTTSESEECVGVCADYKNQRDAYMITMIVLIVVFFISCLGLVYFFFTAKG